MYNRYMQVFSQIQQHLTTFSHVMLQYVGMTGINWVDIVLIAIVFFYAFEGFEVGFAAASLDLLSFIFSFLIALKLYSLGGQLLVDTFGISSGIANVLSFFAIAFVSELVLGFSSRKLFKKAMQNIRVFITEEQRKTSMKLATLETANRFLGVIPGVLSASILLAFLLTIIIALPFSPALKQAVLNSSVGSMLLAQTQDVENKLSGVFGEAINESLTFLTIAPKSHESVPLRFQTRDFEVDKEAEGVMLALINKARENEGLSHVMMDEQLQEVAREHAKDMLQRGYFSHYSPEGLSPFDRLDAHGVFYTAAGENLAFAPSTVLAMQGLMQSPGHRANIVSENFRKVGIGVLNAGVYGKMFVQEFSD